MYRITEDYKWPVSWMAIFVHDCLVNIENHPLPRMIKYLLKNNEIYSPNLFILRVEKLDSYFDVFQFLQWSIIKQVYFQRSLKGNKKDTNLLQKYMNF